MQCDNKSHETKDDNLHLSAVEHGLPQIDAHAALPATGGEATKCGMTERQTNLRSIGQVDRRTDLPPAERPVPLHYPVAPTVSHEHKINNVQFEFCENPLRFPKQLLDKGKGIFSFLKNKKCILKYCHCFFCTCAANKSQNALSLILRLLSYTLATPSPCCKARGRCLRAVWSCTMSCCMQHIYLHACCAMPQRRCIVILPLILSLLFGLWLFLMSFDHI